MSPTARFFQVEWENEVAILTPEPHPDKFVMRNVQEEMDEILTSCQNRQAHKILVHIPENEDLESLALGLLVVLHKRIVERQGQLVFLCGSKHMRDILSVTKLDGVIPSFDSKEEALQALENPS